MQAIIVKKKWRKSEMRDKHRACEWAKGTMARALVLGAFFSFLLKRDTNTHTLTQCLSGRKILRSHSNDISCIKVCLKCVQCTHTRIQRPCFIFNKAHSTAVIHAAIICRLNSWMNEWMTEWMNNWMWAAVCINENKFKFFFSFERAK